MDDRYFMVEDGNIKVLMSGFYSLNVGILHDGVRDVKVDVIISRVESMDLPPVELVIDNILLNNNRASQIPISFNGDETLKFKITGGENDEVIHEIQMNVIINKLY